MPIGGNEVVLIVSLLSMDKLTTHTAARGCLTIVEAQKDFPFSVDRVYWLHSVPEGAERGYHASRSCYEYLVVMSGRVEVVLEDATGRNTYQLRQKDEGLLCGVSSIKGWGSGITQRMNGGFRAQVVD